MKDKNNEDNGIYIQNIAAGGRHSLVLTNEGNLYTFGYGTNG